MPRVDRDRVEHAAAGGGPLPQRLQGVVVGEVDLLGFHEHAEGLSSAAAEWISGSSAAMTRS
jgi:hypothetical protein